MWHEEKKPFWLLIGARKLVFFWHQSEARMAATVWNWSDKTLSLGALLAVLYFSSFHIYFSARLDFPSPPLSAPGSPRMHWTSIHVTIASSRWHALWVILVFSALKNLLSPTWLAFTQFKPCWHICPCKKMFVGHWPLFLHNNSQPLTCLILTDWLQQIFSTAGFPRVVGESGPISSCSRAPPCSKFGYRYGYLFLMLGLYHEPGPIWWAVIVQVRAGKKNVH